MSSHRIPAEERADWRAEIDGLKDELEDLRNELAGKS
jgi:hypothetical protein